jgi:chromosome segregation ATPase
MPGDGRLLDTIRDLELKNWNLTFEVELQKQNVRRLNSILQKERDEGYEMANDLDQKEQELVRSEEGRSALEEKLRALQSSLEEEKLRAETAENRANEWEQKYNEIQTSQHPDQNKKKRKVDNHYQPLIKYDHVIKQFMNENLEEAPHETSKMLTTRNLYESFLDGSKDNRPTFIHFSREISKCIQEAFPSVRHVRTSLVKGYMGIRMKAR